MSKDIDKSSLIAYKEKIQLIASEKIQPDMAIIGPWSNQLSPAQRANIHLWLLGQTYGDGRPGSRNRPDDLQARQVSGELLTWIVYWRGQPVGMVNLDISAQGVAEVVRSVALPVGTRLPDDSIYSGEANISAAMYQRLADLVGNEEVAQYVRFVEGDVRLAAEICLPNGIVLPSGVRTQHINAISGLDPYLLCVPRYQVHPRNGNPHQEAFLQSRKYLHLSELRSPEQLCIVPSTNGTVGLSDIARVTYDRAGQPFALVGSSEEPTKDGQIDLLAQAGEHYTQLQVSGSVEISTLDNIISAALEQTKFVELILVNEKSNIITQRQISQLPYVVPLGVLPGDNVSPTTLHYGVLRPDLILTMVEIELARDYANSPLAKITLALREQWRSIGSLR